MKKLLFCLAAAVILLTSCQKTYNVNYGVAISLSYSSTLHWEDITSMQTTISIEKDGHIYAQEISNTIYKTFDQPHFILHCSNLEEGLYTIKAKISYTYQSSNGYISNVVESSDSYFVNCSSSTEWFLKPFLTGTSGNNGGGGGGGSGDNDDQVVDHNGNVLSGWTKTSNGYYRKNIVAQYVVLGNEEAFPSTTNWTHTITAEYRPQYSRYVIYEPYFNPSYSGGLGLVYDAQYGYNSVSVHTYTHYDSYYHVMYEAECYCRFTIN